MPKERHISWVWNGYGVCSNLASSGEPPTCFTWPL